MEVNIEHVAGASSLYGSYLDNMIKKNSAGRVVFYVGINLVVLFEIYSDLQPISNVEDDIIQMTLKMMESNEEVLP